MLTIFLKTRRHVSVLVLGLAAGVAAGVFLAFHFRVAVLTPAAWLVVAVGFAAAAFGLRNNLGVGLALVAGLLLGAWRTGVTLVDTAQISGLEGQTVSVRGTVFEDPDVGEDGRLAFKINRLEINGRAVRGQIYAGRLHSVDVQRSDRVQLEGSLSSGFGSFAGALFRPRVLAVERLSPGDVALCVRNWFAALVSQAVPEPENDLALGYLVGQRRGLPADVSQMLRLTGLTHIVVASGYNLTVLVRFSRRLFAKVSRFAALAAAGALVICFIAITGVSPSMLRAGLVSGLSLLAWYFGREFRPQNLLVLVAAGTLLLEPSYAVDLGWLLSFGAFAGVMIYAPLLTNYFFGDADGEELATPEPQTPQKPSFGVKVGTSIRQVLIETVSAQLLVLPLVIYYSGQVSLVSLPANLLILPTIPLAMLLTFGAGLGALAIPPLGQILGWLATRLISYHLAVMEWFGSLPWAVQTVNLSGFGGILAYAALIALGIYLRRASKTSLLGQNLAR